MNVIFIAIDTLRADRLTCYGYSKSTSPNLERISKEGVLFEKFYASDIPTQPAYTTIYTSLYGVNHGIVSHGSAEQNLSENISTLPQILREKGVHTAAVDNLLGMKHWFGLGYNEYFDTSKKMQLVTAEEVNSIVLPWLKRNKKTPFFLFIHYWDPHTPYTPPQKYRRLFYEGDEKDPSNRSMEKFKDYIYYPLFQRVIGEPLGEITDVEYISAQYDAEIRYVDERVGEVIGLLEELKLSEETLLIITSDHGESLTEHGIYFDHHGVYETTIRVPLILWWKGNLPSGKKIKDFFEHVDLLPTILDAFGIRREEKMEGVSLLSVIEGKKKIQREFICCGECTYQAKRCINTGKWKLIKSIGGDLYHRPKYELYWLEKDPEEKENLAEKYPEIVDRLEIQLTRWVEEKLGESPDPIRCQLSRGLPGHRWLREALRSQNLSWEEWFSRQRYW